MLNTAETGFSPEERNIQAGFFNEAIALAISSGRVDNTVRGIEALRAALRAALSEERGR